MRKIKNILAIATIATMTFSMAGCKMIEKTPEAIQKTVLAKVGDEKITMADVNGELQADIDYLTETYGEDSAVRKAQTLLQWCTTRWQLQNPEKQMYC